MAGLLLLAACSSPTLSPARTGLPPTTTSVVVTSTTSVAPTTTTVTTLPTTTTHRHVHAASVQPSDDVWYRLALCETGGKMDNPNTGNGYYGYFQFSLTTWQGVGGPGYPHHHPYEVQKEYAVKLHARDGWRPWPKCSKNLGLR